MIRTVEFKKARILKVKRLKTGQTLTHIQQVFTPPIRKFFKQKHPLKTTAFYPDQTILNEEFAVKIRPLTFEFHCPINIVGAFR